MGARRIAVSDLAAGLAGIPEARFGIGTVLDFLRTHPVEPDSLRPYLFFSPERYTRNLIFSNSLFELLAICWEPGQVSSIHNHQGQNCWMTAPVGRLRVQNFRVLEENLAAGFCRLEETDRLDMGPESPAEVDPGEPVHQVLNPTEFGGRAVSLHVYSRPYDRCLVYEPQHSRCREIALRYHSIGGELVKRPSVT